MAEKTAGQRKADLLPVPIVSLVQSLVPDCNALLPADITTEQFRAALWLELTGRPELKDCYPDSLRTCIVQAAQDGMLPGRDCHFLAFRQKESKGKRATKVDNYHGLQRALERTGKVVRSWAAPVCEHDIWEFDRFMDRPKHIEAMTLGKQPGKELFYYGAILFKDGTCAFEPISLEELKAIEASSPAHESGPWRDWPQMMKRKSALKRVCKYVPLTPQIERIIAADDARLQLDIPAERHQQNIIDLFGEGGGSPTAGHGSPPPPLAEPWCDDCNTAGHYPDACPSHARDGADKATSPTKTPPDMAGKGEHASGAPRGQKQPSPEESGWKKTLRAHRDAIGQMAGSGVYDEDARGRLEALVEKMDFALSPLGTVGETDGLNLSAAALEWVEAAKEG